MRDSTPFFVPCDPAPFSGRYGSHDGTEAIEKALSAYFRRSKCLVAQQRIHDSSNARRQRNREQRKKSLAKAVIPAKAPVNDQTR